jgi:hypothetical protein
METARGIVCPHSLRVTVCTRLWAVEAIATLRFGLLAPIAHPLETAHCCSNGAG